MTNKRIYNLICQGGLANESLFAIILFQNKKLKDVINQPSHLTDWTNPSSATSPYVFDKGSEKEIALIKTSIENNKYLMFMRKIGNTFPNNKLSVIISENDDNFFDWYFNYSSLLLTLLSVFLMLVLLF